MFTVYGICYLCNFQIQKEVSAFVKDATKEKHKFPVMDKVYRAIV